MIRPNFHQSQRQRPELEAPYDERAESAECSAPPIEDDFVQHFEKILADLREVVQPHNEPIPQQGYVRRQFRV